MTFVPRDCHRYQCLTEGVLDEIFSRKTPDDGLRVLLLPHASPLEPYLLAIQLLEHWPRAKSTDFNLVVAGGESIISAREGIFSLGQLSSLNNAILRRYFSELDDETWQAKDYLRQNMVFSQLDVTDGKQTKTHRGMDVILCQRLFADYSTLTRRLVAGYLFDAMNPGGFLILGEGESMSQVSAMFTVRRFGQGLVYQKPTVYAV